MAEIKTGLTGYKNFIRDMRAAFVGGVPFVASFDRGGGSFSNFHYAVNGGNLYLTQITNSAAAGGAPTATRPLSLADQAYSANAIGNINKATLDNALAQDFCTGAAWVAGMKQNFDIVLLCTVEAARSKYVYGLVNTMLTGKNADADHIKAVAQMYGHTRTAAGVQGFKALDTNDYQAYCTAQRRLGVATATFVAMGL